MTRQRQPTTPNDPTHSWIVTRALKSVPVVKYALGLAAISILFAIARGAWPDVGITAMFPLLGGILGLMLLLVVIAVAAENRSHAAAPALMLVWAISIGFVVILAMTLGALAFGKPEIWAGLILPKRAAEAPLVDNHPRAIPTAENAENLVENSAVSAKNTREAGLSAPPIKQANSAEAASKAHDVGGKEISDEKAEKIAEKARIIYLSMIKASPEYRHHNDFSLKSAEVYNSHLALEFKRKGFVDPKRWNSELFADWADQIVCANVDMSRLMADGLQVEFIFADDGGWRDSFMAPMCDFE